MPYFPLVKLFDPFSIFFCQAMDELYKPLDFLLGNIFNNYTFLDLKPQQNLHQ